MKPRKPTHTSVARNGVHRRRNSPQNDLLQKVGHGSRIRQNSARWRMHMCQLCADCGSNKPPRGTGGRCESVLETDPKTVLESGRTRSSNNNTSAAVSLCLRLRCARRPNMKHAERVAWLSAMPARHGNARYLIALTISPTGCWTISSFPVHILRAPSPWSPARTRSPSLPGVGGWC